MAYKKETQYVPVGRGDYVVICREWTIIKDDGEKFLVLKKIMLLIQIVIGLQKLNQLKRYVMYILQMLLKKNLQS